MLDATVSRRAFLKGSGGLLVGTIAFASGAVGLLAPSRTWALELKAVSAREGEALLALTRHIFPHKNLEDAVYALVVKDLDAEAAADGDTAELIADGVKHLDTRAGGDWLALDAERQAMHVRAIAGDPFFEEVRGTGVVSLYDNDMAITISR